MKTNEQLQNIRLELLNFNDYQEFKNAMIQSYPSMPESYWKQHQVKALIDKFPEGQVVK